MPLTNGGYYTIIIKKTPLRNGNSPNNTDPITEMGVEHACKPDYKLQWLFQGPVNRGGKDNSYEIVSELTSNDVEEEVYSSLNDDTPSMKSKRQRFLPSIGNIEKAMWVLKCLGRPSCFWQYNKFLQYVSYFWGWFFCFHGGKSTKFSAHCSVPTKKLINIKVEEG